MDGTAAEKYENAFHQRRPEHALCDDFSLRHPKMPLEQRAKIFSPFAALKGFEEAIGSKLEQYVGRVELSEEDQTRIDQSLHSLCALMKKGGERPVVTVRFYVPCSDENHEAYGLYGQYRTLTGTLRKIDPIHQKALRVDETVIEFSDISEIRIGSRNEEDA